MKIASWNVNSIKVRLPQVIEWLNTNKVDVLALQETKTIDEFFPQDFFKEIGYQVTYAGQKTYNGVAIISSSAITDVVSSNPFFQDKEKRFLAATINDIRVVNLYVPNGQSVDSAKYTYKLAWLKAVIKYLENELKNHTKIVVLGDFNIAPNDIDVHDPLLWEGSVLVSTKERQVFKEILDVG